MTPDPEALAAEYRRLAGAEAQRWAALEAAGVRSWADAWEARVDASPAATAVVDLATGRSWSYRELDQAADRVAAWAARQAERSLALRGPNGAPLLAAVLGLAKAGRTAVLLKTREPLAAQAERCRVGGAARALVVGEAIPGVPSQAVAPLLAAPWPGRAPAAERAAVSLADPCAVIFTSGTQGPSKGALFSHRRMIGAGVAWALRCALGPADRCYIPLPLYHGNGLAVAFSSCVEAGAAAVVRDRFSVRAFSVDVRRHGCTAVVYIGELWRYLANRAGAERPASPLRVAFGNGLGEDLWAWAVEWFGLERVVEHFGATEMPAGALTNWAGRPGRCGYIPPDHPDARDVLLVDDAGRPVACGQPGEALLRVPGGVYRGYVDPSQDAPKVWRDLVEPGDAWWRSGDLLVREPDGFFRFVERRADGFRFKGENVSAAEVEGALRSLGGVREAAVFPLTLAGTDGQIGAAAVVTADGSLDPAALLAHLQARLAPYALPRLVRVRREPLPTTGTLKVVKAALAAEGTARLAGERLLALRRGRYGWLDPEEAAAFARECGDPEAPAP